MKKSELERLEKIENRVREIAIEEGLMVEDIVFEIVPAERIMEVIAYIGPTNYSHWTFGRDFEKMKTIYNHTGTGLAYEVIFNTRPFNAFLIETNPFTLNVLVVSHCFGHMDMYLANEYCGHQNKICHDMTIESRLASRRFEQYSKMYGAKEVENVLDAALSIVMHQNPDLFFEEPSEDAAREFVLKRERAKSQPDRSIVSGAKQFLSEEEMADIDEYLLEISQITPPIPTYNIIHYLVSQKHMPIEEWVKDILRFTSMQYRYYRSVISTKLLHEGWATYWHRRIFERLFAEKLVTDEEYGIFSQFDSEVRAKSPTHLNPYNAACALFEYIEERWDKGQFGVEYENCDDPFKKARWDTGAKMGKAKIFEVRRFYNDRMAVENFFTDDFIQRQEIYLHEELNSKSDPLIRDIIVDTEPRVIRESLKRAFALQGIPRITVEDGNYNNHGGLYLIHHWTGYELEPIYRDRVLEKLYYLWGRPIYLETQVSDKICRFTYNENNKKEKVRVEILKK